MAEATLRISAAGGAELRRVLGETRAAARAEAKAVRDAAREASREAQKADKERTRAALRELAQRTRAEKEAVKQIERAQRDATRMLEIQARARGRLAEVEANAAARVALAQLKSREQAERRLTQQLAREQGIRSRQEAQAARVATREQARRPRELARDVGGLMAAGRGIAGLAASGLSMVGAYGDTERERAASRDQLQMTATRIAAGDIGDARASGQIMAATQSIATGTGLNAEDVMSAIGTAQADFSQLSNAADRFVYLNQVLPQLAQVALATGDSLRNVVGEAGEFQRQLGITGAQLPQALAASMAEGRLGSISAADTSRYFGQVGSRASRFLSTDPAHAMDTLATSTALFQMSGRGGGGGAESATRTRAFLDYMTSADAQRNLSRLNGGQVFDRTGQIVTRQGESQSNAFMRAIETAFSKSHGSSNTFLDAVAGNNTRARGLGDQLLRDLRLHGGRLADTRALVAAGTSATAANTYAPAAAAVGGTHASQVARLENQRLFAGNQAATDTQRQIEWLSQRNEMLGNAANNQVVRGLLDTFNASSKTGGVGALNNKASAAGIAGDRRAQAYRQASAEFDHDMGWRGGFMPAALRQQAVDARAAQIVSMDEATIARFVAALRAAPMVATVTPQAAALAHAQANTANGRQR